MKTKKIVVVGGPGSGKSSIINELISRGFTCFEEISREVILEARKNGDDQLFLTQPLLFSELLLKGRHKQYLDAEKSNKTIVFLDRGTPDVIAYMDYVNETYPDNFIETCELTKYNDAYILRPWQDIYKQDNERYETFEEATKIHDYLVKTYTRFGYQLKDVPFGTVSERVDYILNSIKTL